MKNEKAKTIFYRLTQLINEQLSQKEKDRIIAHYWLISSQIALGNYPRGLNVSEGIAVGWL